MSKASQNNKNTKIKSDPEVESFGSQVSNPHIAPYIKKIHKDLQSLKKILFSWSISSLAGNYYSKTEKQILKKYVQYHHDLYQYDQFDSSFILLDDINASLNRIVDQSIIFKSFDLFKQAKWPVRFNSKFVARLNDYNINELYYVLGSVYFAAAGNLCPKGTLKTTWGHIRPLQTRTITFNKFYSIKIYKQKNMFMQVGVQKVPIVKNGFIKRYEFRQYMQFLDILGDQYVENKNKFDERMNIFLQQITEDVAKKDHSQQLEIDNQIYKKKLAHYLFTAVYNEYTQRTQYYNVTLNSDALTNYSPLPFKVYYVSSIQNSTLIFDQNMKRWLSKSHVTLMEKKKLAEYQKQISDSMIKRFVDFQSAKSLVELLTKIPNFKVNLTQQQKNVIGQNGNVLVIGRSGTGKTTCAVLRLFSIEMLFKIRLSLFKKKFQYTVKDVQCGSNDIDQTFGLHCIFLTASPVLTHQIQRYYKKLTDNIKAQLEKKKKKKEEEKNMKKKNEEQKQKQQIKQAVEVKIQSSFEQLNDELIKDEEDLQVPQTLPKTESQKSAEVLQEQQQMNNEFKDIQLREDFNENFNEEEDDIDQLKNKFEQNIKKFHNLYDLSQDDYPGFFTVKSFIMLIDGVLSKPFFIRSKNTIVDQDQKSAWHNQRKGVMMIQNYYKQGEQQKTEINQKDIEEQINYSDQEELQHQYLRQIQLRQNKDKQQLTKKLQKNKNKNVLSFQVDYDYFIVHFWPRIVKKYYSSRNITAHLVWTQIYSTIKGSAEAHQFPGQYLTQNAYMSLTSNSFLTRQQKLDIYQTFCQYERWKIKCGGYDIMDAVNYILNFIRFRGYDGPEIHYIMIDEVQDLPHAMVYLLSKTATYGIFYSGDTAQTIAKGVGFRFCDLKSLFNPHVFTGSLTLKNPVIKHLTVNFRSHNNILQLANSIVSALQILFPKTIDRLKKEISDLSGPKPMIIAPNDQELLFYVLCGQQSKPTEVENQNNMKKPPLQFGCDQVIIVRDQQSKTKIPSMLQHALCLTIYQAKGLQFNDVILFNFFTESPCPQKWSLLKSLHVITTNIPKDEYHKNVSFHKANQQVQKQPKQKQEQLKLQAQVQENVEILVQEIYDRVTKTYSVKKIVNSDLKNFRDINDYAELCSELKLLYTAITRPRKTLIIYDDIECHARSTIQKIWDKLNVVQIISKQIIEQSNKKGEQTSQVKIFQKIITSTDSNSWKQQGLKMYSRGYFDQAMKCFQRSGNFELYKKAEANKNADQATKKLIQIQSERNAIKQSFHLYKNMTSTEISKLKKKLKSQEQASLKKFKNAAEIFQEVLMFKQAGQCYFSGKIFDRAEECFAKAFMNKQIAESLYMQNKYREAAQYYEKDDNYLKIIECLDLTNQWVLILQKIQKFANKMSEYEKQALLKKYSALALQELVYQIEFENEEQCKKPQNNRVQIIVERESDQQQQDSDEDEDPELAAEREYQRKISAELSNSNPSRKQSEIQEQRLIEIKDSIYEKLEQSIKEESEKIDEPVKEEKKPDASASFEDLNDSQQMHEQEIVQKKQKQSVQNQTEQKAQNISMSFEELNDSSEKSSTIVNNLSVKKQQQKMDLQSIESSFSQLNAKYDNELEPDLQSIKSLVDPDDIWVKNSISEISHKLHSQYSVIDDSEQNYSLNVKIIKTKGNIFVQDQIMKKIVNIVSIVNISIHQFFKQFKGYQSLISVNKKQGQNEESFDVRPEITEFQDIDPKFINIILDTLESFKLFKLCLFVCNRYHLPSKAGRYLISLGMKYSTNCISNNVVNPILLAPSAYRKTEIQRGILASIALHSIYQNVNAQFLKIKVTESQQDNKLSLGSYFIQGLILEGAYKKAVFMVNTQQSLKILSNYNDFNAYNNIFRQKLLKVDTKIDCIQFLPNEPSSNEGIQFSKMILRKVMFDYCVTFKFQTLSMRYYKQFEHKSPHDIDSKIKQYEIPKYLPFTKILFEDNHNMIIKLKSIIEKGYKILQTGTSLQILDLVAIILVIVHNQDWQQQLVKLFTVNQFLQFYRCVNYIRLVLRKYTGKNAIIIIESVLNIHQCFRIRYCKSMSFINDTFCFVNRISTVANQLIQNSKVITGNFAYFFEQDYNYIICKTARIVKIICKKYQVNLIKLYKKRVANYSQNPVYLAEDFIAEQEQNVLKRALTVQIQLMQDPKSKKKQNQPVRKISKQLKPSFDFKYHGKEQHLIRIGDSSESQEEEVHDKQCRYYRVSDNPKMRYISSLMLHSFLNNFSNSKDIIDGKDLYSCNMNSYYREYLSKKSAFNLFDAIEFKKFKRVDLFAENILSIYDNLTIYAKHCYLAQILILLLVQYKTVVEPIDCIIKFTQDQLKYLQNLQFQSVKGKEVNPIKLTKQEITFIIADSHQCVFNYKNKFVSQMEQQDLAAIISEYLQILKDQQISQYVNFSNIILTYVLNVQGNQQINEALRKIINLYAKQWKCESLYTLSENKSVADYQNKRTSLISSTYLKITQKIHHISVENIGNLDKAIEESQFDYEVEGKILEGRKKAVSKIVKWWRAKSKSLKQTKNQKKNYLQYSLKPQLLIQVRKSDILGDIRLMKSIYNQRNILQQYDLLIETEQAKQQLLSFYLTTTISSSLDFHFILMSLNKIEECRKHYFQYCRKDIEYIGEQSIDEIKEEVEEMRKTIDIWKKDEKWMREKNINLKKKKVFEVKWMTKNLGLTSILKKRAGLKKQAKLQQKKRLIKKIK